VEEPENDRDCRYQARPKENRDADQQFGPNLLRNPLRPTIRPGFRIEPAFVAHAVILTTGGSEPVPFSALRPLSAAFLNRWERCKAFLGPLLPLARIA